MYEKFRSLDAELDRVTELIDEDNQELPHTNNLLLVHFYISKLEEFRLKTIAQTGSSQNTIRILDRYFQRLDSIIQRFDALFWKICSMLDFFVVNEEGDALVKVLNIVEKEEQLDLLAVELKNRSSSDNEAVKQLALMNPEKLNRIIKSYKSKFFEVLNESINKKFEYEAEEKTPLNDILQFLGFFFDDLSMVNEMFVPRFPKSYKVFEFYCIRYHNNIHRILDEVVTPMISPSDILLVLSWVNEYYDILRENFNISKDFLDPVLLEEKEEMLIQIYMKLAGSKLGEWMSNLLKSEKESFIKRESPPEKDVNDNYISASTVDLFQIVKQSITPAASATNGKLLFQVIKANTDSILKYQEGMIRCFEEEASKYFEDPSSVADEFEDYVIMHGNSCLKFIEFMDEISADIETNLDSLFQTEAMSALKMCNEGFLKVAKTCNDILVKSIFNVVSAALCSLFTKDWYNGQIMETVLVTFDDYLQDYKEHMEDYLFNRLVAEVLDTLLIEYLKILPSKNSKLHTNYKQQMESDIAQIKEFFCSLRPEKRVLKTIEPVEKLIQIISGTKETIFIDFYACRKLFGDLRVEYVEQILSRRKFEKQELKDIIQQCREKTADLRNITKSIFSRIN